MHNKHYRWRGSFWETALSKNACLECWTIDTLRLRPKVLASNPPPQPPTPMLHKVSNLLNPNNGHETGLASVVLITMNDIPMHWRRPGLLNTAPDPPSPPGSIHCPHKPVVCEWGAAGPGWLVLEGPKYVFLHVVAVLSRRHQQQPLQLCLLPVFVCSLWCTPNSMTLQIDGETGNTSRRGMGRGRRSGNGLTWPACILASLGIEILLIDGVIIGIAIVGAIVVPVIVGNVGTYQGCLATTSLFLFSFSLFIAIEDSTLDAR